ncbi:MAG: DinB family protein [Pseudomonadota bacterium]
MKAHFRMMAAYNAWANRRLCDAALELPEAEYHLDLGAFFGSVHRTLNHIMVADLIWIARIRGQRNPPFGLDHILHDDLGELSAARKVLDDDILRLVEDQDTASLAGDFTYTTVTDNREVTQPLAPAMAHLFNNKTHHRGQVHALLTRLGGKAPSLDLIYFQRQAA